MPNVIKFSAVSTTKEFDFNQFADLEDDLQKQYSDFVIFPENILNQQASSDTANNIFPLGNKSTLIFQNLAKKLDADVVVNYGTLQGNKNELKYNSAILFNNEGNIAGIHNKNRLIFIGEYWPFGNWHPSFYDWVKKNNPRMQTYAIFDQHNADLRGEQNLLSVTFQKKPVFFAAPICGEIHYLADLKKYQEKGAQFIVNQSSNRWLDNGLNHFLYLTENLKKIESIWLSIPIISSGVNDHAGIILPDGKRQMIEHENGDKNYGIFSGEIRY